MGGIDSFALRRIQNLKDELKRNKKDCHIEAIDLFKKIHNAIDAHTDTLSVNKGLDDLALEVCDLEEKLSIITKERDSLLNTVNTLKAENMQLSATFLPTIPLSPMPDQKVEKSPIIKEVHSLNNGSSNDIGQGINRPRIHKRGRKQKKQKQKIQRPLKDTYNSDDYDFNGVEDADIKDIDYVEVSQTKDLIQKLIREGHADVKKNDTPDYEADPDFDPEFQDAPDKKFKCDQCPWSTPQRHRMKAHVEDVHEKIKSHNCEECGYATSRRDRLERHWDARHNQGEKKFKCGRCPYSSPENAKLQRHIGRVHG